MDSPLGRLTILRARLRGSLLSACDDVLTRPGFAALVGQMEGWAYQVSQLVLLGSSDLGGSRGACTPKGLLMFITLSRKGVYTPFKVGWKPGKPRAMNKGYVPATLRGEDVIACLSLITTPTRNCARPRYFAYVLGKETNLTS